MGVPATDFAQHTFLVFAKTLLHASYIVEQVAERLHKSFPHNSSVIRTRIMLMVKCLRMEAVHTSVSVAVITVWNSTMLVSPLYV